MTVNGPLCVLHGSFHQGHGVRFANAGRQCMAISVIALVQHRLKSWNSWNAEDLDETIVIGDSVYSNILASGNISDNSGNAWLCTEDLPWKIEVKGHKFSCVYDTAFATGHIWSDGQTNSLSVDTCTVYIMGCMEYFKLSTTVY